jgi:transcriptional regulator with XRE-family HTH domain
MTILAIVTSWCYNLDQNQWQESVTEGIMVVRESSDVRIVGERIRERRKELGLNLRELAQKTDLTASFLSLVERGHNTPSLDSLRRITEALDVPLFFFNQTNGQKPIVRRDERIKITFPPGDLTCELLVPNLRNRLEMFISRVHPSAGNIARPTRHSSDECIYLLEGQLRVCLQDGEYDLRAGDSIYFHGSTVREICARGEDEAIFVAAITPPVL